MHDIRNIDGKTLADFLEAQGEKAFKAKQVMEWLWKKGARSFNEMTNLSLTTRQLLASNFTFEILDISHVAVAADKTRKVAFRLPDNKLVEGVLIPSRDRATACISTQVGCNLKCKFCATALLKYERNLTATEIFDQVVLLNRLSMETSGVGLSNIVIMGMGEPLMNYDAVISAINKMIDPNGLAMSPHRITLSTVGIVEGIRRLADDMVKFNLAISLHTADSLKRDLIIPANKNNNLDALSDALRYFYEKTGSRVTFEYILINKFNDSLKDARKLAEYCRIVPCKVNLIEYNEVEELPYKKSSVESTEQFKAYIESKNMIVNIRRSRGGEIDAACGQLALRKINK